MDNAFGRQTRFYGVLAREITPDFLSDSLSKMVGAWAVSALDREGRTIWIVDAHRDGKRFIVHADEKLSAFMELESAMKDSICSDFHSSKTAVV